MEISIAQNVAGQIQELLQISCIFLQLGLHFSCIFLHFNFSYKNGFAFSCIFLHFNFSYKNGLAFFALFLQFFCSLIFGGPFFSCIFFASFSKISFLLFSRKRQQPDHTTLLSASIRKQQADISREVGTGGLEVSPSTPHSHSEADALPVPVGT